MFLLRFSITNTVHPIKTNSEIRGWIQIPNVLQKDVCLIIMLHDVMYPGQLKHYGLLGIKLPLGHRFRWHSMWSIVSKQKCVQLYFPVKKGGWGAEYKGVKDLFHRETVFQIGVKKKKRKKIECWEKTLLQLILKAENTKIWGRNICCDNLLLNPLFSYTNSPRYTV